MIVYSHTLTPRLQYVVQFLSDYYQHPFKLTANEQAYLASEDFKINYSHQKMNVEELYINPHALLFETEKRRVQARCFQHHGYTAFFETSGEVHFDLFAALFFLVSRYEEYLPHKKDAYGMYAYQNSLAYEAGFLQQPLINIWLEDFKKLLEEKFQGLRFPAGTFRFLPTYNVDEAWCYKYRGSKQHSRNVFQAIIKGKWKAARERIRVVKGKQNDPYDAYEWMDELHQRHGLNLIYFFLVAEQKGKYDNNISIHNPEFQLLIKDSSLKYETGIHPSWSSGDHKTQLSKEKKWLESIIQKPIVQSRQHFLRFQLPGTFQQLQSLGITHEYSMGYRQINGFRASIASPYNWYDLEKEQATSLRIHPFCFMDAVAYQDQGLTADQAYDEMLTFYTAIKEVKGLMITIWHNSFLGTAEAYSGWKEAYEQFIETVSKDSF